MQVCFTVKPGEVAGVGVGGVAQRCKSLRDKLGAQRLAAVVLDAVVPVGVCSWDVQGGYALHFSKVVKGGATVC